MRTLIILGILLASYQVQAEWKYAELSVKHKKAIKAYVKKQSLKVEQENAKAVLNKLRADYQTKVSSSQKIKKELERFKKDWTDEGISLIKLEMFSAIFIIQIYNFQSAFL